jgi:methionyl-tRNA formyltransferase
VSGSLSVVVLTSGRIGIQVAARLAELPEVRSLAVVTTHPGPRRGTLEKARRTLRYDGAPGLKRAALARVTGRGQSGNLAEEIRTYCPGAAHLHFDDLHAPEALAALAGLRADLGVVAATYVLRPEVFTIPRLGCLNLHLGLAPEFRGSSPGFYEMLEGVGHVGVTVHRVTAALDGGPVLAQERFPLELAPAGDPLDYLRRYQLETLVPNGARMMASVVAALTRGAVAERAQPAGRRPRRRATWPLKRELRRVVRARRAAAVDIVPGRAVS